MKVVIGIGAVGAAWLAASAMGQGDLRMVVLQGDAVPGVAGAAFAGSLGTPVINASGNVAFTCGTSGAMSGGVFSDAGSLHVVARSGGVAPGAGGRAFADFGTPPVYLSDGGAVAFSHGLTGSPAGSSGIWAEGAGGLNVLALDGLPSPSAPLGTYLMTGFQAIAVAPNGVVAFNCNFLDADGMSWHALFSGAPGSIGMHARQDVPPGGSGFTSFGIPMVNRGWGVCVPAGFSDGAHSRTGIFAGPSGGLLATATSDSPAPDRHGDPLPGNTRFGTFGASAMNGANAVAFLSTLTGVNAGVIGLFVLDARGQHLVAMPGDAAEGLPAGVTIGSLFNSAPSYADNGDLLVGVTLSGAGVNSSNDIAILRYRGTMLSVAVREGQATADRAGTTVGLASNTTICTNASGQLAFVGTLQPGNIEALLGTDRAGNLLTVYRSPTAYTVRPGMRRSFGGFIMQAAGSGNDGRPRSMNDSGEITLGAFANIPPGEPFGQNGRCVLVLRIPDLCPADFNGDGFLDFFDYDDYVNCFETGLCPPGRTADFSGDGFADFFDYDEFVEAFEAGC